MNFTEAVLISLASLRANRLRSLLTLLGIVIGVMAVIAVISIISGLNDYVAGKIFNLGPDVVTVTRMSPVITSLDDHTAEVTFDEKATSGKELEGATEGNLCIAKSWPGQMRTVYGDHERFFQTYFTTYPGRISPAMARAAIRMVITGSPAGSMTSSTYRAIGWERPKSKAL